MWKCVYATGFFNDFLYIYFLIRPPRLRGCWGRQQFMLQKREMRGKWKFSFLLEPPFQAYSTVHRPVQSQAVQKAKGWYSWPIINISGWSGTGRLLIPGTGNTIYKTGDDKGVCIIPSSIFSQVIFVACATTRAFLYLERPQNED